MSLRKEFANSVVGILVQLTLKRFIRKNVESRIQLLLLWKVKIQHKKNQGESDQCVDVGDVELPPERPVENGTPVIGDMEPVWTDNPKE